MNAHGPCRRLRAALLGAGTLAVAAAAIAAEPEAPGSLHLEVEHAGTVASSAPVKLGFVSGLARLDALQGEGLDVLLVIDASAATLASAEADIDGDGRVSSSFGQRVRRWLGRSVLAGPDSVLAAEIAAALGLLDRLDPRVARVGVVAYAGGARGSADNAWVQVELTSRFERVRERLRELLETYPPGGRSDLPAGLRLASIALGNRDPARRADTHLIVLSGGPPGSARGGPLAAEQDAIRSARRMGERGARIHSYAVGPAALEQPRAAVKVAEQSGGVYFAIRDPSDLVSALPEIDLSEIAQLRVRHLGTGEGAVEQQRSPDGGYAALVPLQPGENPIEVYARTADGRERRVQVTIDAGSVALSPSEIPSLERFERRARPRELEIEPDAGR